jgi:uncharacterized protein
LKEKVKKIKPFHVLAKPIGPVCNIDCTYCFYLEKENLYPDKSREKSNWTMQHNVLESYIKQKLEASDLQVESFAWQGGEPTLLGVDYFRKVVELQKKYANGKKVENAFQTNGILLDDEWCEFLNDNQFLVGLSIDGPREFHDKYRVDKGGKPTFDKVVRCIDFMKKHNVEFNTLTVVQNDNADHPLEIYRFLKEIGSGFMQFIPIVERIAEPKDEIDLTLVLPDQENAIVSEWSVKPQQFGSFLTAIFDEWVRNDVGKTFVQLFDISLQVWADQPAGLCLFTETCGRALVIEHNGDLYSCDHYVYPGYMLGNIMGNPLAAMVESEQQVRFGLDKRDSLPRYCRECEVRFICNGECPKNRFLSTPDGDFGLNYLCAGYTAFFNHIDPYMRFMTNELRHQRAPSNVMQWTVEKDNGFPSLAVGRNEECPCGSGKKFKRCCSVE